MFKNKRTAMLGTLVAALFLSLLTLMAPGKVCAAYDCFLRVAGIQGGSMDAKYRADIEVISWSFGESQATTGAAMGAGRVKMQDFKFTKRVDKASVNLFLACAKGEHIKEAVLEVVKPVTDQRASILRITLSDVVVSSYLNLGNSKSTEPYPLEEVTLNFGKIKIEYTGTGGPATGGWDSTANKSM